MGIKSQFNKFLRDFATDRAVSIEVFDKYNFNKFTLDWNEFHELPIKDHTLNLDIQGASDKRIKTDIQDIDNAFEKIMKLRPVKFKYTDEWKSRNKSIQDIYYYN